MRVGILLLFVMFAPTPAMAEGPSRGDDALPRYDLSVAVDTAAGALEGVARIVLPPGGEAEVHSPGLSLISVRVNGKEVSPRGEKFRFKGTAEITYKGVFGGGARATHESTGVVSSAIGPEGVSLTGDWYPHLHGYGLADYRVKAVLPEGFAAVSEAEEITVREVEGGVEHSFMFPHPLQGVSLAAGRYVVKKETLGGVDIYAYFFPEDAHLADGYLSYTKGYIERYTALLGPYPYRRFSVVENFVETGYSMPTFTLLGRTVVNLPFILETSLGHEVLHQWFGNSVYSDYERGNWTEGLVAYLADHQFEADKGLGWEHRKRLLTDYQAHVTPAKEFPLESFSMREDFATRAVGYGKAAMVFHMLRGELGEEAFNQGLRGIYDGLRFKEASWDDLRRAFEAASGRDMGWFFDQWLKRTGAVDFVVTQAATRYLKAVPTVAFTLEQRGEPYSFNLPVRVLTDLGAKDVVLRVEKRKERFEVPVEGRPATLVVDGDYSLMRRLSAEEYPPVVARLIGDEKRIVVTPGEGGEVYSALVDVLARQGFTVKKEGEIKDEELRASSVLVLGLGGPTLKRLYAGSTANRLQGEGFGLMVMDNPIDPARVVAVAYASSKDEADAAARKIFRYGRYSLLRFLGGRNVLKEAEESDRGMSFDLHTPIKGVRPGAALTLPEIIEDIKDKGVVYVGESHSEFEDHRVQLEVIKGLWQAGRKLAIGMEMFPRGVQAALDVYTSGKSGDLEFLKASQYFKSWGMEYNLYREIIEFAREKGIPIVALNIDRGIIAKVARGGLDALTEEERKEVPEDMDMSDALYRERLKEAFAMHERREGKGFEDFYQSQVLWDEAMAHSIDRYLRENPDRQMVVVVGQGHVAYGSGIPRRAHRLNGRDYAVLVNSEFEAIDPDVADYIIHAKPLSAPEAPRLMVVLEEKDEAVLIAGFQEGSASERAGMRKGDAVLSVGGLEVKGIEDVKIALYDLRKGEPIEVRVLRKRLLRGPVELAFSVQTE